MTKGFKLKDAANILISYQNGRDNFINLSFEKYPLLYSPK
jgi:hypothetical protein